MIRAIAAFLREAWRLATGRFRDDAASDQDREFLRRWHSSDRSR